MFFQCELSADISRQNVPNSNYAIVFIHGYTMNK